MATINMPARRPDAIERLAQGLGIANSILGISQAVGKGIADSNEREKLARLDAPDSAESAAAREGYKALGLSVKDTDSANALERAYGKMSALNEEKFKSGLKGGNAAEDKGVLGADKLAEFQSKGILTKPGAQGALTMDFLVPGGKRVQYGVLTAPPDKSKIPESELSPKDRLSQMPADSKNKVGMIASALGALTNYEVAFSNGERPKYIDKNTPIIGRALSDTDITSSARQLNEAVGRLQSGGAINSDERAAFDAMGPTAGDSEEQKVKKLGMQRQFLEDRLTAFGFRPSELGQAGFDVSKLGYDDKAVSRRQAMAQGEISRDNLLPEAQASPGKTTFTNDDLNALDWVKKNPHAPQAGEIRARLRAKGLQ